MKGSQRYLQVSCLGSLLGLMASCSSGNLSSASVKRVDAPAASPQVSQSQSSGDASVPGPAAGPEFPTATQPKQITGSYLLDCGAVSSTAFGCGFHDVQSHALVQAVLPRDGVTVSYSDGSSEHPILTPLTGDPKYNVLFHIERAKIPLITALTGSATIAGVAVPAQPVTNLTAVAGAKRANQPIFPTLASIPPTSPANPAAPASPSSPAAPSVPVSLPPETQVGVNLLQNPGFEMGGLNGWGIWEGTAGITVAEVGGHSGTMNAGLAPTAAGQAYLYQTLSVSNGNYSVSCWIAGGSKHTLTLQAKDYDLQKGALNANVPSGLDYTLYNLDVVVSSGLLTLAVWFEADTAADWAHIDDCSMIRH